MPQVIYVADDEKNIRELIAAFLTQEGFQVRTFSRGDALLAACEDALPDLVVLDIMMPGTDGLSVCSMLRKGSPRLPLSSSPPRTVPMTVSPASPWAATTTSSNPSSL